MYNPQSGKIVYTLPSPMRFSDCEISLISSTYYNSFKNISATLGNNVISGHLPSGTTAGTLVAWSMTLADGFYSISDMNNALWNYFVLNGLYLYSSAANSNIYFAQIIVNPATYVVQLQTFLVPSAAQAVTLGWTQPAGGALVLSTSGTNYYAGDITITANLGLVLGIPGGCTTTSWNQAAWSNQPGGANVNPILPYVGTLAPALNPVTSLIVRCNLVCARIGNPVDMLCQIPLVSSYGAVDQFQASYPTFAPVVTAKYSTIELSFMDQNLNTLYFFDPELTFTLQIKHK